MSPCAYKKIILYETHKTQFKFDSNINYNCSITTNIEKYDTFFEL